MIRERERNPTICSFPLLCGILWIYICGIWGVTSCLWAERVGEREEKRALYYPPNNYKFPCVPFSFIYTLLYSTQSLQHLLENLLWLWLWLCACEKKRKRKEKKRKERKKMSLPLPLISLSFMFKMNNFARFVEILNRFLPLLWLSRGQRHFLFPAFIAALN